jgi:hypothetical protein
MFLQPSNRRHFATMLIIGSLVIWMMILSLSTVHSADAVDCDIQTGACIKKLDGRDITFDIQPKPVRAMHDLLFRVTYRSELPHANPYIDLGMPGMRMGPNRVDLKPVRSGIYEGAGIIVRCPSGRKVWRANVTVPNIGEVSFTFHVVY